MHKYFITLTETLPRQQTIVAYADTPGQAIDLYMRADSLWPMGVAHAWDCPCTDRSGRQGAMKELFV